MYFEIDDNNVLCDCYMGNDEKVATIPEGVTVIGGNAFDHCQDVEYVYLPSTLRTISYCAFMGCNRLKKVFFSEGLTTITTNAFAYCTSLETIELPDSVIKIDDAVFDHCTNLRKVVLPSNIKRIGSLAFNKCVNLEDINISPDIEEMGYNIFRKCQKLFKDGLFVVGDTLMGIDMDLSEITMPDKVKYIHKNVFNKYSLNLRNDSKLETIFMNKVKAIPDKLFDSCSRLKNVVITDATEKFGNNVFVACYSLRTLILPDSRSINHGAVRHFLSGICKEATIFIKEDDYLEEKDRFLSYLDYLDEPVNRQKKLCCIWDNSKVLQYLIDQNYLDDYEIQNAILDNIETCRNEEARSMFLGFINSPRIQTLREKENELHRETSMKMLELLLKVSHPEKISGKLFLPVCTLKTFDSYQEFIAFVKACNAHYCSSTLLCYLHLYRDYLKEDIYIIYDEDDEEANYMSLYYENYEECIPITETEFNEMIGRRVED